MLHCLDCSAFNNCNKCQGIFKPSPDNSTCECRGDEWVPNEDDTDCVNCLEGIPNCNNCTVLDKCKHCKQDYYLSEDAKSCQTCKEHM